jgi:cyanophycinase
VSNSGNGKSGNGKSANGTSGNGKRGRTARPAGRAPIPVPSPALAVNSTIREPRGTLIIIGGHEDKEGQKLILRAVAERVGSGALVVATVASGLPGEVWGDYEPLFTSLGVRDVRHLHVTTREEARSEAAIRVLDGATAVFITGGDQLKLTSQLGDTPIYTRILEIYERGGTIAGTSAGASVMCETMLIQGEGSSSHQIGTTLRMGPGFGLIPGVIIDQHFAERGRIGRLIAAVAQNPRILGIGIDENTAIICDPQRCFSVLGAGAVYVVDGREMSYSNLADEDSDRILSSFDLRLHLLSMGDEFDIATRRPENHAAEEVERELVGSGD